jgi:hypothetical protein
LGSGFLQAWPGLVGRLGVWSAGLAQKSGLCGLGPVSAMALEAIPTFSKYLEPIEKNMYNQIFLLYKTQCSTVSFEQV